MKKLNKEYCPVCEKEHSVPELKFDNKGKGSHKLINCKCGAILETVMPFIRMTQTGYMFRNVRVK